MPSYSNAIKIPAEQIKLIVVFWDR